MLDGLKRCCVAGIDNFGPFIFAALIGSFLTIATLGGAMYWLSTILLGYTFSAVFFWVFKFLIQKYPKLHPITPTRTACAIICMTIAGNLLLIYALFPTAYIALLLALFSSIVYLAGKFQFIFGLAAGNEPISAHSPF